LGRFTIGPRVALLWQHNANPSSELASIPQYDDIVRTADWAGSARVAGRRTTDDGERPQNRAPHTASGRPTRRRLAADWGRSQHCCGSLQCGLSTGGVLAIKSERKMLASTCLYLLYAWLLLCNESPRVRDEVPRLCAAVSTRSTWQNFPTSAW